MNPPRTHMFLANPPTHRFNLHAQAVALGVLALGLHGTLHAQVRVVRPDGGVILQQQTTPQIAVPQISPQVLPSGFAPKPALDALPSSAVAVKAFMFSGNTVFSAAQLAPLVNGLVDKTATLAELNTAADKVRQYYRERGYLLAQAYLPRQDVTQGKIEITVLEGYAGRVLATTSKAARLKQGFAQSVLDARLQPGQIITERALETPLLILSDLPGVDVKSAIGAGTAVGTADIDVTIGQQIGDGFLAQATGGFVTGGIEFDSNASSFTGANRVGANVAINNATGYGDQLSVRTQIALENRRSNFAQIGWQMPVGYYGTQAGVLFAKLNYALIGSFAALQAEGDASITALTASQPLLRSRNLNATAYINYEKKRIEDRTLAFNNVETRNIDSTRVGLRGDWRDALLGGGLNTFNLALVGGKLQIEQAAAVANDQGVLGANTLGNFGKTNLDLLRLQTVTQNINLLGSLKAQWASKNLSSAEKITLGGANDVRAYPSGEASGDQGYVGTLEARYTNPAWRIGNATTVLSTFYDYGSVTISKNPLPGVANNRSIKGAGLGLTVASGNDFAVRAAMAWRIGNQLPLSDADRSPRFWLQASKSF